LEFILASLTSSLESPVSLEQRVDDAIRSVGLKRPQNRFFQVAREVESVTPEAAYDIAFQFRDMTKEFMFSTISSIGAVAKILADEKVPRMDTLGVLQTAYRVIGDDLDNFADEFAAVAPKGPTGIHYIWWQSSVVDTLESHLGHGRMDTPKPYTAGVAGLIKEMRELRDSPIGFAVQLRVVETIALDVAVAFRRMYPKVVADGVELFPKSTNFDWLESHIRAETGHAQEVSKEEYGMSGVTVTEQDREQFLTLVERYARHWANALDDFTASIS
jgi:hypothetical protein